MNQLATVDQAESLPAHPVSMASAAVMMSPQHLQSLVGFADMMSKSAMSVPDHLRGKPSDCLAIAMQAAQWGMNPFAVAQKTHIVSGRLGYEAQLVIAVVQASGSVHGAFHYEYQGDGGNLQCRVGAQLRGHDSVTWSEWLSIANVATKNSPLWKTNPKQQIGYLQAKNWARLYCPGAILGVYTPDELEILPPVGQTPRNAPPAVVAQAAMPVIEVTDDTRAHIARLEAVAGEQGTKAFKRNWNALSEEDRASIGLEERDRLLQIGQRTDEQAAQQAAQGAGHE